MLTYTKLKQDSRKLLAMTSLGIPAKPVLKWAGGKGQLIEPITLFFPAELASGKIKRYIEPFVGGGAIFFHIARFYPVTEFYISDVNEELILLYRAIRENVELLIKLLARMEAKYFVLSPDEQRTFFYEMRLKYNSHRPKMEFASFRPDWLERAAQLIFLNRTCFNGLFRVNAKGEFNVPFGDYKNPKICDCENLMAVSQTLKRVVIQCADFAACEDFVTPDTFVYLDPPYRPISKTASFTSYSRNDFDDAEQSRLARFYKQLDQKGSKLMLSNSDPKNENPDDNFFENLYANFKINRVRAARMINSNASKRGPIAELLITNYEKTTS